MLSPAQTFAPSYASVWTSPPNAEFGPLRQLAAETPTPACAAALALGAQRDIAERLEAYRPRGYVVATTRGRRPVCGHNVGTKS